MKSYATWTERILPVLLLAVAAVLIFTNLSGGELRNGDEARYAIVAQEILHTGDPVTLHYDGQPYFQKAPFRFWLSAATYRLFGVHEFTVRFWSALAGLGCILVTWWLGKRLWGAWAGLCAALILATTPAFLHVHGVRTGEMDTLMTLCWLLALVPLTKERLTRNGFLVACFFAAACGMVKHLAFAPLAFLTLGLGLLVTGRWRDLTRLWVLEGAAVALLVVGPWHLVQWYQHGNLFWEVYLGRVVVETAFRFTGPQPGPGYYFEALFAGGWPWPFLWTAGLAWTLANGRRHPAGLLPVLMLAVTLLFTVVAQRKLAWYVIPAYPALALAAAGGLARGLTVSPWRSWSWSLLMFGSLYATFLIGTMTWFFADRPAFQVPLDAGFFFTLLPRPGGVGVLGVLFGLSVLAGLVTTRGRNRPDGPLPKIAFGSVLVFLVLAGFAVRNTAAPLGTITEPAIKTAVARVNETVATPGAVVLGFDRDRPRDDVVLFYLYQLEGNLRITEPASAQAHLTEDGFAGLVLLPDNLGVPSPLPGVRLLERAGGIAIYEKTR